jgi:hypothetical protein
MSDPLWKSLPDSYVRCERCDGTGDIPCRWCDGQGTTVGYDRYLYGRTIGKRFGLKRCTYCHGRGTQRCGLCILGSVERPGSGE